MCWLLKKVFVRGESVVDKVAEEMRKTFTEERKLIANEIKKHMYKLF